MTWRLTSARPIACHAIQLMLSPRFLIETASCNLAGKHSQAHSQGSTPLASAAADEIMRSMHGAGGRVASNPAMGQGRAVQVDPRSTLS